MSNLKYSVEDGIYRFATDFGVELHLKDIRRDRNERLQGDARFVTPEGAILALSRGDLESLALRRDLAAQAATRNSGDSLRFENVMIEALVALDDEPCIALHEKITSGPQLVPMSEFIRSMPPVRQALVEGLFEIGTLHAVVAKPKVAKSLLVLGLAVTVSGGGGIWLGRKVVAGRVALFQLEDSSRTIGNRILKMTSGHIHDDLLVQPAEVPFRINEDNYRLVVNACNGCCLIIVDPIIQASSVGDWNAASEVREAYELWRRLARQLDAVVVVVAHHRKLVGDYGDQIAGSIQGLATPDGIIEIRRDASLGQNQRKVSYVGRDWPDLEEEIIDLNPDTLRFSVVGSASALEAERKKGSDEKHAEEMFSLLPTAAPGITYGELQEKLRWGDKVVRGAMTVLIDSGRAVVEGKAKSRTNPLRFYRKDQDHG